MKAEQMEMQFKVTKSAPPANRRHRRMHRAAWWFSQMRRAVDAPEPASPLSADQANRLAMMEMARA